MKRFSVERESLENYFISVIGGGQDDTCSIHPGYAQVALADEMPIGVIMGKNLNNTIQGVGKVFSKHQGMNLFIQAFSNIR